MNEIEKMKHITGEWYLYHNIKNENALIPVIIISFLTFFIHNGWLISLSIWVWYIIYCNENNNKLNNDPIVIEKREIIMKIHEENGEAEKYKRLLGI